MEKQDLEKLRDALKIIPIEMTPIDLQDVNEIYSQENKKDEL